jgi:CRP-like cAMP-binding protein
MAPNAEKDGIAPARRTNCLLAGLPSDIAERLQPDLTTLPGKARQVLYRQGDPIEYVYFPNDCVASVTSVLATGAMVETATVGDEGMIGIEAIFAERAVSTGETIVQVPGTTIERLSASTFRAEIARRGEFERRVGRYAQVFLAQVMQTAACNALHPVQERCCRWLLQTHDRVHGQDFALSHEFLGVMLGVRRSTVTVVAGALQSAGLIRYAHGRVRVIDRRGLEEASCECYCLIREQFDRLECETATAASPVSGSAS